MLQCVAACCSVLRGVAVCIRMFVCDSSACAAIGCIVLQCAAVCCSVLQSVCCNVLQCVAVCCSQCLIMFCSVLQCVAVCCSVLQGVAVCIRMFVSGSSACAAIGCSVL